MRGELTRIQVVVQVQVERRKVIHDLWLSVSQEIMRTEGFVSVRSDTNQTRRHVQVIVDFWLKPSCEFQISSETHDHIVVSTQRIAQVVNFPDFVPHRKNAGLHCVLSPNFGEVYLYQDCVASLFEQRRLFPSCQVFYFRSYRGKQRVEIVQRVVLVRICLVPETPVNVCVQAFNDL